MDTSYIAYPNGYIFNSSIEGRHSKDIKMTKTLIALPKAEIANKNFSVSDDVHAALNAANGRAARFTYDALDILRVARLAEARLDRGNMPQADRIGFTVTARSAGPAAAAYKNSAIGTEFTLRRAAKGWVLVAVAQATVYPKMSEKISYAAPAAMMVKLAERATFDIAAIAA